MGVQNRVKGYIGLRFGSLVSVREWVRASVMVMVMVWVMVSMVSGSGQVWD